jgi:hypothetical protein
MIIPTYWTTSGQPSWKVFDHPVPIDEEGTLARTLDNLQAVSYPDPVVLFPAPLDGEIVAKVRRIAEGRSIDVRVFSEEDHAAMIGALRDNGFPVDMTGTVAMTSYGGVRNIGLIYAALHGFENVVMIDDDECIDGEYLRVALGNMGRADDGVEVLGKTGCVVNGDGHKVYDGQATAVLEDWPKDTLFNEAVRRELEAEDSLSSCSVAFGGNMVLNAGMFLRVPFDPYGTRGEDDDYVLNARRCGYKFYFDKELVLLHLPPKRNGAYWMRQRQDILRFKYLREKAKLFGFAPESLGCFLEHFVQDDLEYKAVSSSIKAALQFVDTDRAEFQEFLNNAILAEARPADEYRAKAEAFVAFLEAWQETIPRVWRLFAT